MVLQVFLSQSSVYVSCLLILRKITLGLTNFLEELKRNLSAIHMKQVRNVMVHSLLAEMNAAPIAPKMLDTIQIKALHLICTLIHQCTEAANVMVVSCVYPSTEKYNFGSNSLNRVNGIMLSGSHTGYTDRSNINGPGTPRPLSRSKVSLSSPLTTNGLPNSTDREINVQQTEDKSHSDSPTSHGEDVQSSCSKNKHLEDSMEAEAPEVKRLKFDKENEEDEPVHFESSSEMPEESENTGNKEESKDASERIDPTSVDKKESSSPKMNALFESDQEKVEVSFKTIKTSDENQMDQSDLTKTLTSEASEISETTDTVSNSVDKPDTPPETQMPSESPMENSTDVTEEPMEQD
ncbi:serine/threonine-protein phosphatase 4 regulatory subunit 2-B isoform X3 [Narcine bancroftii]|uniref:serine/threonine-protein phosphatase 4 regulatory subunit 2-B isoform X3 n=1 Tax=Narcine bancroftii TaxID=1343680 RepID=UPI00383143CF